MKKIKFLCILLVCALCSCSTAKYDVIDNNSETVLSDVGSTSAAEAESTASRLSGTSIVSTAEITEASEERHSDTETSAGSDITLDELAVIRLDEMMNSLIQKNAYTWQQYIDYIEGDDGYLYNVDFEDYEVIDLSVTEEHELYHYAAAVFNVEISVSKSNDIRFPQGRSRWEIMLGGDNLNFCLYFLRDVYSDAGIYLQISENKPAELGYVFSYSFDCYETVNDVREYCLAMDYEAFLDGLKAFVIINDEIVPQIINEWGDPGYSKDDVNVIVSKYLGINDYSWGESFDGAGGDRLWKVWDMTAVHIIITEQTDNYIDMVYFADYSYLTPAKKMRYYFIDNDGTIQLLGTELLEDYGYEPNWNVN